RVGELDRACQLAAIAGARRAGLRAPLFVNVEPDGITAASLDGLARTAAVAGGEVPLVLEITERALTARPAELIDLLARARAAGWGIALDDVGTDPRSLALLPVVRPDVVKLDRALLQERPTPEAAGTITAIAAECERTGALVLAEGIEREDQRALARALGATLGQGWLFGHPAPAPPPIDGGWRLPRVAELHTVEDGATPFTVVAGGGTSRRASWPFLLQISHLLEAQALAQGPAGMLLSAFQTADRFTPATAVRYRRLAGNAAFVAAFGVEMAAEPVRGVRGARLPPEHALRGEWSVVVLGPHFSGALVARELPGQEARPDFAFTVTYDRDRVVRAATSLMRQVARIS
ncbi:MAG TPA: EAL domain-containing protein, partial [Miltoncostaea sp.]|nr:EAL domain-containing protein [Miltoncostaea sp.]